MDRPTAHMNDDDWFSASLRDDWLREVQSLRRSFGVRTLKEPRFAPTTLTIDEAVRLVRERTPKGGLCPYDPERVLEHQDWWYVPLGNIGCAGHIVDKRTGAVEEMGSSNSLDDCFWAHENGISFNVTHLTILHFAVDDTHERRRFLAALGRSEMELTIRVPFVQPRAHLWFEIPQMRAWSEQGQLRFQASRPHSTSQE